MSSIVYQIQRFVNKLHESCFGENRDVRLILYSSPLHTLIITCVLYTNVLY